MEDQVKETVSEAAKLIPEGYVDLIRRIVPGLVLFLTVNATLRAEDRVGIKDIQIPAAIILVVFSYFIGLVLDAITDTFTKSFFMWAGWRNFDPLSAEAKVIADVLGLNKDEVEPPKKFWQYSQWKMPGLLRMHLMQKDSMVRSVLPKLIAEEFLARNTVTGLSLMLLSVIIFALFQVSETITHLKYSARTTITLLSVVLLLVFIAAFHRSRRTIGRTREWFHLNYREFIKSKQEETIFDLNRTPNKPECAP